MFDVSFAIQEIGVTVAGFAWLISGCDATVTGFPASGGAGKSPALKQAARLPGQAGPHQFSVGLY